MEDYKNKYEHACKNAKEFLEANPNDEAIKAYVEDSFPELKETKPSDEEIKAALINHFKDRYNPNWYGLKVADIIAWIEKQGEKKTHTLHKFREGDWVIGPITCYKTAQVLEVNNNGYALSENGWVGMAFEGDLHLWTIKDANPGDVLCCHNFLFIYKDCVDGHTVSSYLDLYLRTSSINNEIVDEMAYVSDTYPATKEQCELLFSAMEEHGYKWDQHNLKVIDITKPSDTVKPKFEIGDRIKHKTQNITATIVGIENGEYILSACCGNHIPIEAQESYEYAEGGWCESNKPMLNGDSVTFS